MKIEHLIVQHLYNNKKVTLQDIGSFTLSPDIAIPLETDGDTALPENAVIFEYNPRAKQDEDLVSYVVSQTRKIKPLASSDLESYTILAKQFLNIGKPFPIEGLGVLQKAQSGEYEFLQGHSINLKIETPPALLKEKKNEEISFSSPPRETTGRKWLWIVLLIVVAATGALLYYFLKKENRDDRLEKVTELKTDTLTVPKDTSNKPSATIDSSAKQTAAAKDSFTFKIVIREYASKEMAEKAFAKYTLYGHKLLMYPKDSSTYIIAMPFTSPLSDTTHAKDSLRLFFNARTYVDMNR